MTQVDLPKKHMSGLFKALRILKNIEGISIVELDTSDVVRHKLVKEIIKAYEKSEDQNQ
jgi:phosphate starvation-inducible PhoH-like protein